jgi:hypothetical protein
MSNGERRWRANLDLQRGNRGIVSRRVSLFAILLLLAACVADCVIVVPVPVPSRAPTVPDFSQVDTLSPDDGPAVRTGPALSNVASLPVDSNGAGTLQGIPTGEAWSDDTGARFEVVLDPAPAGVADRSTVSVAFDHTTQAYRGGIRIGDPFTALETEHGNRDVNPTSAGMVTVQFHIKNGRPFADRLDLSDDQPDDSDM